jgi:hypothetical protein
MQNQRMARPHYSGPLEVVAGCAWAFRLHNTVSAPISEQDFAVSATSDSQVPIVMRYILALIYSNFTSKVVSKKAGVYEPGSAEDEIMVLFERI